MFHVDRQALEEMVVDAIDCLPRELRDRMDNVAIGVEDVPTAIDAALANRGTLLGLYRGVPLTARNSAYGLIPPDRILIFQRPLEALANDEAHLRSLVGRTVLHEIAHHFGISDSRLREIGAY